MSIGIITGSGAPTLSELRDGRTEEVSTPYGGVKVTSGSVGGVEVLHVSRHGDGHVRLSNLVNHRANTFALKQLGAGAVIALTACGAVDSSLELGQLVIFDDLHFPSNRLPDGSLCTFFDTEGDPARAHWVLDGGPFSAGLNAALTDAALAADLTFQAGGTYGHVDGPRFNTPSEIAQLAACGVCAVSQTAGPETVLMGELEVPFALVGFVTDYANGANPGQPTPVSTLGELMSRAGGVFSELLEQLLPRIAALPGLPQPAGTVFRIWRQ